MRCGLINLAVSACPELQGQLHISLTARLHDITRNRNAQAPEDPAHFCIGASVEIGLWVHRLCRERNRRNVSVRRQCSREGTRGRQETRKSADSPEPAHLSFSYRLEER